ncbi:MAG: hypothetical protein MI922_20895, partial [Bacteroidales bacterium]|nr:hypothetical protein [Bacteroidales bacterium]
SVESDYAAVLALINKGEIRNSSVEGSVLGYETVGGLVAYNSHLIDNCESRVIVNGTLKVGGLVGENAIGSDSSSISNCLSVSEVFGLTRVGGLIGCNNSMVSHCYSEGSVHGNKNVGGSIGFNDSRVRQCYSHASVQGTEAVGGFVGYNFRMAILIEQCYSTGIVTGETDVGGFAGINEDRIENCFWDVEASGLDSSASGTGWTTVQMQERASFVDWDFEGTWMMCPGEYPRLLWEGPCIDY